MRDQKVNLSWFFGFSLLLLGDQSAIATEKTCSMTFYFGQMTSGEILSPFSQNLEFLNAYIFVGAITKTIKSFAKDGFSLELEGQVGKYWGRQKNWEMNLALAGRWKLPWPEKIKTSLAWGIGPSYATEVPKMEPILSGSSRQWLIYWFGEVSFDLPNKNWAWVLRLHHRSPGFGLLGTEGGANILGTGLKYFFE